MMIKKLAAVAIAVTMLVPAVAAQTAANLTGKWTGSFAPVRPDGSSGADTIELNLTQKGKEITGTAGPNAERQWALSKGVVAGDKVTFVVQVPDGPMITFDLTLTKDRLVGEAKGVEGGEQMNAKIDAGRVK
jgi:hypothetical protein